MNYQFKPVGIQRGSFLVISVDGTRTIINETPTIPKIKRRIAASVLDTVNLRHGEVMLVDDTGVCDGKPVNPEAVKLMKERFPGYPNPICGDVAIVLDEDFANQ